MNAIVSGFPIFLLIFCRITAFFVVAPIFSAKYVPKIFKLGLGFAVSFLVFLSYGLQQNIVLGPEYILLILREVLMGLLLGFVVYLFFSVVQAAGAMMDMQIGFAMANVVDPNTGASAPLLGHFKYMLLMVVFLMLNGHHYLLAGLMNSYAWMPIDNELFSNMMNGNVTTYLTKAFSMTFLLAIQVAAPLMVALFLTDVGLGFLTKTAPQFNIFVVGIPIKIIIGLFLLILLIPATSTLFENLFSILFSSLEQLFVLLQQAPAANG